MAALDKTAKKILLAEDDPNLGMITRDCILAKGYDVNWCKDGAEALDTFPTFKPDLCLFDVMMPVKDGFTLAEEVRKIDKEVPFIFLTAKSLKEDVIKGFNLGADDYIKKPFHIEELLMRIDVVLSRGRHNEEQADVQEFDIGAFHFDYSRHLLSYGEAQHKLTGREADLLKMLCSSRNQLVERKEILLKLWGDDSYFNGKSLNVFITKLRKYLSPDHP